MLSGPLIERETLINTRYGFQSLPVQLGLRIHSRGTTRGFNEDPAPALLSSVHL